MVILSALVDISISYTRGLAGGLPCICMAYCLMRNYNKQTKTGSCPKLLGCNRFTYRCISIYIIYESVIVELLFCQTPFNHWFDLLSVVSWLLMGLITWKLLGEALRYEVSTLDNCLFRKLKFDGFDVLIRHCIIWISDIRYQPL